MTRSDAGAGLVAGDEKTLWQDAITSSTHIERVEGRPADIRCARNLRRSSDEGTTKRTGFEKISEGRAVVAKSRQAQEANT